MFVPTTSENKVIGNQSLKHDLKKMEKHCKFQNRFSPKPEFSGFNGGRFRNPHSVEVNKPLSPNLPVVCSQFSGSSTQWSWMLCDTFMRGIYVVLDNYVVFQVIHSGYSFRLFIQVIHSGYSFSRDEQTFWVCFGFVLVLSFGIGFGFV